MSKSKIIAIMGSPSSGKTMTSIKLATALAGHKKTVVIVALDGNCPVIPYVLPSQVRHDVSLGDLLHSDDLDESNIQKACISVPDHTFIKILGYRLGETGVSASEEQITSLIQRLQESFDFVLLDCTCVFEDNSNKVAILLADILLQLGTATTKGLTYYASADQYYDMADRGIFIVGNYQSNQDKAGMSKAYGEVQYILPYCEELSQQLLEVDLFAPLKEGASKDYKEEIDHILGDVFHLFPEKMVIYKKRPMLHKFAYWILNGNGKGEF